RNERERKSEGPGLLFPVHREDVWPADFLLAGDHPGPGRQGSHADRGVPEGNPWSWPWSCQCARRRDTGRAQVVSRIELTAWLNAVAGTIYPEVRMPLVSEID